MQAKRASSAGRIGPMGSRLLGGSAIGHVAFWVLMIWAWVTDSINVNTRRVFLVLWFGGWLGLKFVPYGEAWFSPFVALLDIVLVLVIFKGDIRLR
jgi:hypothetical protein